jgi:hypothetical protein
MMMIRRNDIDALEERLMRRLDRQAPPPMAPMQPYPPPTSQAGLTGDY